MPSSAMLRAFLTPSIWASSAERLGPALEAHGLALLHDPGHGLRQPADIGHDMLDHDPPLGRALQRRQRDLAAGEGRDLAAVAADARQPAHGLASLDHHPHIGPRRRGDMSDLAARQPVAQPLGQLAQLQKIRGHGAVDPAVLLEGRVEDAARARLLRQVLGLDVIHRPAGGGDHHIGLDHGRGDGLRRLHAALGPRRHHHDDRIGAEGMSGPGQALGDRGAGPRVDHDDDLLAGLGAHVVGDDAMGGAGDFDRLRQGMSPPGIGKAC